MPRAVLRTLLARAKCMATRSVSHLAENAAFGGPQAAYEDPIAQGSLRFSGAVLDAGAHWYLTVDCFGWSTLVLLSEPSTEALVEDWDIGPALRRCAERACGPVETALAIRDVLRSLAPERAPRTGLAVARFGPDGAIVELLNASLSTVLAWDPIEGLCPYEPLCSDLDALTPIAKGELIRLRAGSALVFASEGVLPSDAGWATLASFVRLIGLDAFGGTVADAPQSELARMLRAWGGGRGPAGFVVAGVPSVVADVA
jgi:hypothetical protein